MLMRCLLMFRMLVLVVMSLFPCTVAMFVRMLMVVGMFVLVAVLMFMAFLFVLMPMFMVMLMLVRMLAFHGILLSQPMIFSICSS
jgi:hypothetical protein